MHIGGDKAREILLDGLRNQTNPKIIGALLKSVSFESDKEYIPVFEAIAENVNLPDGARSTAIVRTAKAGAKKRAVSLGKQYIEEDLNKREAGNETYSRFWTHQLQVKYQRKSLGQKEHLCIS
jgi:hypothetical protein